MAQVSYGTITITDTNDIERIYVEYCRSTSNQLNTSVTPPVVPNITINWSENTPPWVDNQYIWQRSVVKKSGTNELIYGTPVCLTGAQGTTGAPGRGLTGTSTMYCNYGSGTPTDNDERWQSTPPTYNSTYPNYWVKITNTYSAAPLTDIIKYKDEALTQTIYNAAMAQSISQSANENAQGAMSIAATTQIAQEALATKLKYIWTDEIEDTTTPAGSYMASGIDGTTFNTQNPATYGFNSQARHSRVAFRYNAIDLTTIGIDGVKINIPIVDNNNIVINSTKGVELTSSALKFYQPPTISGGTVTQGALAMNLSSTELTFFKPDASNTQALVINSDGVDVYGDTTGSGAALSGIKTAHFGSITTIGPTSYRHIQLSENNLYFKFSESVLGGINFSDTYRNEEDVFVYSLTRNSALNFTGSLNYNSDDYLKTGSFKITYVDTTGQTQTMSADNVDLSHTYTHTFSQTEQIPDTGIKLYQFIINFTGEWGEGLTSGDVVSPNFNLQIDSSDSATLELHITYSARIDGPHYIFGSGSQSIGENSLTTGKGTIALGDFQFVTGKYNESDKEAIFIIGNGSDNNNRSNVFVVDKEGNLRVNNGFQIYNNDETDSIAEFGATARIGKINNSHFLMNANSLQAYNSSSQLYFEVSNAGIRFGNNLSSTVATQTDVANASYSVEIQVTSIDYANNSATLVAIPYYQGSTTLPTGVTLSYQWYKNGSALENTSTAPTITGATTNTLQLGQGTDFGSSTTNAIYTCVIS